MTMPARILREDWMDSDAMCALSDKAYRCWMFLFSSAKDRGNMEAHVGRLRHLWSRIGIDSDEKVEEILVELEKNRVIKRYRQNDKNYVHIPKYRQRIRHWKADDITSPWDDDPDNQAVAPKTTVVSTGVRQSDDSRVDCRHAADMKGSERKGSKNKPAPQSELTLGQPIVSLVPELDVPPPTADERTPTLHKAIYDLAIVNLAKQDINPAQSRSFTSGCLSQWSPEDVMDCFLDSVGKEDFRAFSRKLLSLRKKKGATLDPRTGRDHRGKDADGYAAGCNPYKDWGP